MLEASAMLGGEEDPPRLRGPPVSDTLLLRHGFKAERGASSLGRGVVVVGVGLRAIRMFDL